MKSLIQKILKALLPFIGIIIILAGVSVAEQISTEFGAPYKKTLEVFEETSIDRVDTTNVEETILTDDEPIEVKNALDGEVVISAPQKEADPLAIDASTASSGENASALPNFTKINERSRKAVVNIFCTTKSSGIVNPITGSGVVIDPRGIILTNAHIAQYFLLENYPTQGFIDCVIRTGSPAQNSYTAELLYIPAEWIVRNSSTIRLENPTGTGEYDYALLRITGSVGGGALPEIFPFVLPDVTDESIAIGNQVLIASYPAGFLGIATIFQNLYPASTVSPIVEIFTFGDNKPDLISTGGSVVAQKGSSGGGVVNISGKLQGIVVTATDALTTNERDLRAITLSHINRSLSVFIGENLFSLISGNIEAKALLFNETTAPTLTNILVSELTQ